MFDWVLNTSLHPGVDTACFRHQYTDLILMDTETTIKRNSRFLSNLQHNVNIITRKRKINVIYI